MGFLRPEAIATLTRWRAVLLSLAVVMLGLWWALLGAGIVIWIGGAIALAGGGFLLAALQRLRFGGGMNGPGVVRVDEAAIAYFGPLTGGAVSLNEISSLILDRSGRPAHWVLAQPGQPDLFIPLSAAGSEALFDAFATLPGIRTERMLSEMQRPGRDRVTIWQRHGDARRSHLRLH